MKRKEENGSVIEPSCTFSKPNKINCLPSNRVLDRKPDRVTGYKVLIHLTSLQNIHHSFLHHHKIDHISTSQNRIVDIMEGYLSLEYITCYYD